MDSLIPNSHRLIYFMEGKKALRASRCPRMLNGRVRARRVKTVSSHLNSWKTLSLVHTSDGSGDRGGHGSYRLRLRLPHTTEAETEASLSCIVLY